jgi:hypothetical protein
MSQSYEIQGRTITLPVVIRKARSWAAQYLVSPKAAQRLVEPTGLKANRMVSLAFVRYEEGDLDSYDEFALNVMVRDLPTGKLAAYIHRLPVSQSFTCEAGRTIWGYPKWVTHVAIDGSTCRVGDEVSLSVARGVLPFRLPPVPTYSFIDGVLRRTEWEVEAKGVKARPGGARITLGDGELADELRSLGLPKRALMTTTVDSFKVSFGAAEVQSAL